MGSNDPRARQEQFNARSFDQWDGFAGHRRKVSDLLAADWGRLCVLGAGNANDLDLGPLLEAHRQVHLVDLDASALARGADRQGVRDRPNLFLHGNLDVTAMMEAMARWSPLGEVSGADLAALVEWPAGRVGLALPGPFDVVASACLLSQLIGNAHHALGEAHPQRDAVARAIRLGHLRLLASLVRPGGRVVLINDVASSEWVPGLAELSEAPHPSLIAQIARDHGLIRGVDPFELMDLFRRDPSLGPIMGQVRLVGPWTWRLHSRIYLVCGIVVRLRHREISSIRICSDNRGSRPSA